MLEEMFELGVEGFVAVILTVVVVAAVIIILTAGL